MPTYRFPRSILLTAVATSLVVAGCSKSDRPAPPTTNAPAVVDYPVTGKVIAVAADRGTAIVHHDEIPGFMPPMTMEFIVKADVLARLKEGDLLRARLTEPRPGSGELHLEDIVVLDPVKESAIAASAAQLRQDTSMRGKGAYREMGETLPSFTLYNQEGEVVPVTHFRGRWLVLNFIYTRCPIATMCPASTQRMMDLQRAAHAKGFTHVELASISLDPAYDTPPVLKAYALARGIDLANFTFLTGPEGAVRDLLHQFGVIVEPGDNYLKHTLSTLLINPEGKIVHRVDGTNWSPDEILRRIPAPKLAGATTARASRALR